MAKKDYSQLSKEELLEEIKRLQERKKYGLVWEDKEEIVATKCHKELPVLKEIPTKLIEKDSKGKTNILIEGDNYHALSVLNYTHYRNIDVIYIDPPYNTGAKDWKYNNDYVDINDMYRHSKWLSFMEKRLKLAKTLLKSTGVLICTIDDNEHATLGVLLQEIFPSYEIACITIIHNPAGVQGKNFSYTHEYAYFVYPNKGVYIGKTTRETDLVSPLRDWGTISKRDQAKTCFYPIIVKNEKIVAFGEVCDKNFHPTKANLAMKDGSIYIYPIDKHGVERKWVFSRKSVVDIKNQLFCKKIGSEIVIMRRKNEASYRTVWDDKKYYANIYGSKLLNRLIKVTFPFPKSLYAVADCIKAVIHNKNDATILDFFAGSGTTGHAVMLLNKLDDGKRKFILCTNNENKIAEEVCYPRIKNSINGVSDYSDITGFKENIRYYQTTFISKSSVSDDVKYKLVERSREMICIREDTYEEIVNKKYIKIFKNSVHYTAILFHLDSFSDFKKELYKLDKETHIYVFSLTTDTYDEDFRDLKQKYELCPIPESILQVYKRVFRE